MIRMLIVGYCFGIRSERRPCEDVHLNLAYRWFCRLGLDGAVPDRSTFSKNRHGRFRERASFAAFSRRFCAGVSASGWLAAKALRSMPASSRQTPTGRRASRVRRAYRRRPRVERSKSIWLSWTMRPSGQRPRSRPSSCRRPIRRRVGPALMVDRPSSPIPPTI
jgi:hypothetical protein